MTEHTLKKTKGRAPSPLTKLLLPCLFLLLIIYLSVFKSSGISEKIIYGFLLAARKVLPTAFPFMIISDLYLSFGRCEHLPFGIFFAKILGVPQECISPYVIGNVFGFPLGAKATSRLYSEGLLDRNSATTLSALANNPSLPFVFGVVGGEMYGNTYYGAALYFSVLLSTLLTGLILSRFTSSRKDGIEGEKKNTPPTSTQPKDKIKYSFSSSVTGAALSSLYICAFISFASLAGGLMEELFSGLVPSFIFKIFPEVTGGCQYLCSASLPLPLSLSCCAFTLAFGGLSVFLQSLPFLPDARSAPKYLLIKLLQGALAFLISLSITLLIFKLN